MSIESLAFEKDFAALSPTERDFVLSEMTPETFEHLHKVLKASRKLDESALPPQQLRARLLAEMAAQPKPFALKRFMAKPVPLWQAAAVAAAFMGLWFLQPAQIQVQTHTEIQQRTDTVWLEKVIWKERLIVRNHTVIKEIEPQEPLATKRMIVDTLPALPSNEWSLPRVGTSLGDTPELMDFFTQGDK